MSYFENDWRCHVQPVFQYIKCPIPPSWFILTDGFIMTLYVKQICVCMSKYLRFVCMLFIKQEFVVRVGGIRSISAREREKNEVWPAPLLSPRAWDKQTRLTKGERSRVRWSSKRQRYWFALESRERLDKFCFCCCCW